VRYNITFFNAIAGVVKARKHAGAIAFLILVWVALKCFTTLICATNRAWGISDYNWWRLPLKSLVLLGITVGAVLLGMVGPALVRMSKYGSLQKIISSWVYALGSFFIPLLFVFFGLSLFLPARSTSTYTVYRSLDSGTVCNCSLAGRRKSIRNLSENFTTLNVVFGTIGGSWHCCCGFMFPDTFSFRCLFVCRSDRSVFNIIGNQMMVR